MNLIPAGGPCKKKSFPFGKKTKYFCFIIFLDFGGHEQHLTVSTSITHKTIQKLLR